MDFENDEAKLSEMTRRYLKGQLSEAEKQEFELLLMDNPEHLEQVQLDALLSKHLPAVEEEARWQSSKNWITEKLSWGGGGLLAGVACTLLLLQFLTPPSEPETRSMTGIDIVYMDTMRGENESLELVFDSSTHSKLLVVDVGVPDNQGQTYSVALAKEGKKPLLIFQGVNLNRNAELTLLLSRAGLMSGAHRLEIVGNESRKVQKVLQINIKISG